MSKGEIGGYMSAHRNDNNINELKTYFNSVIDWVSTVFKDVKKEMQGLEWGRLYEQYHSKSYDPEKMSAEVKRLYGDPYVKNDAGYSNSSLAAQQDTKLLEVRVFDEATKQVSLREANERCRGEGQIQLPALRDGTRREQEQDL